VNFGTSAMQVSSLIHASAYQEGNKKGK